MKTFFLYYYYHLSFSLKINLSNHLKLKNIFAKKEKFEPRIRWRKLLLLSYTKKTNGEHQAKKPNFLAE